MSTRQPRPDIGIVTTLPVECFGMLAVLNDIENAPDPTGGSPSYGECATSSCAASLAGYRIRPNRNAMCGIACGVPNSAEPERHVRLGDILVAEDGVIPYGHIRVDGDGKQLRRPASRPSVALRDAARQLRLSAVAEN
jgi:hypothetical protein